MNNNEKITIKDCIAIAIDIRKSTTLHRKLGTNKSTILIAHFIEECYIEMNKIKVFNHYIYAGDGIIGVSYTDDNQQAFDKVFNLAQKIKQIIIKYHTKEEYFLAGIGIAFDKTNQISVNNLPTQFNNKLFVGDSISISTKVCGSMPLNHNKYGIKYIGMRDEFVSHLSSKYKKECHKTTTKYVESIA